MDKFKEINGTFGDSAEDIGKIIVLSNGGSDIKSVYIFSGTDTEVPEVIIDRNDMDIKEFYDQVQKFLVKVGATRENRQERWIKLQKEDAKKFDIDFDDLDAKYNEAIEASNAATLNMEADDVAEAEDDAAYNNVKVNPDTKKNKYTIAKIIAGAAVLIGLGYGLKSCTDGLGERGGNQPPVDPIPTEAPAVAGDNDEVNDLAAEQEETVKALQDMMIRANGKLAVSKHILTEDDKEAMTTAGQYINPEYDFARLGFTAEEIVGLNLFYGKIDKDTAMMLTGRDTLSMEDIIDKPNSWVNQATETLIYASLHMDEFNIEIDDFLLNPTDQEREEFNRFVPYVNEMNKLLAKEPKDEKEAKEILEQIRKVATEFRTALTEYGYGQSDDAVNTKDLNLRVFDSYLAWTTSALNMKDTFKKSVFDTKTGRSVEMEITNVDFMPEWVNRDLVEGRDGCEDITDANGNVNPGIYLTIEGVSDRYILFMDENVLSEAEKRKEDRRSEVQALVDYQATLFAGDQSYHGSFDAIVATSGSDAKVEGYSEYDKLTYGTRPMSEWMADLDAKMEELDIFEANEAYFASVGIAEKFMALNTMYSPTSKGKKGDTFVESKFTAQVYTDPNAVAPTYEGDFWAEAEAGKDDWADNYQDPEDPERKGAKSEEDANKKHEDHVKKLQGVYDASFNHFIEPLFATHPELRSELTIKTSYTFDPAWANDSDPEVVEEYYDAKNSAEQIIENYRIADEINKPTPTPEPAEPTPKPAEPTPKPAEPTPAEPTPAEPTPEEPKPTQPEDPTTTPTPTPDWAPAVPDDELDNNSDEVGAPLTTNSEESSLSAEQLNKDDGKLDPVTEAQLYDLVDKLVTEYYDADKPEVVTGSRKR